MNKTSLFCVALLSAVVPTKAANLYWDTNDISPGAADDGFSPHGFWDFFEARWNTDPTGAGAGPLLGWTNSADVAVFSAGSFNGPYTVEITGTQTAAGVIIEDGAVTFANGTAAIGSGTIAINNGASLSIDSSLRLSGSAGAKITLDGGELIQTNPGNAGSFISSAIQLEIGAGGGTVNYTSSGGGAVTLYQGTIVGSGTLIKRGPNEFRYQGTGLPDTTFTKLRVEEGLFRLGFNASVINERGFGADPATFTQDAITLSGGGAIGTSFSIALHANRGLTLGAGGGVINATAAALTIPGKITGSGSLTLWHNVVLSGENDYTGGTVINGGMLTTGTGTGGGTVTVNGSSGLGATTNPLSFNNRRTASAQNVVLNLSSTDPTITGSLSGFIEVPSSGTNTLTINNRGQLFTVNQTVPGLFPGVISGSGGFTLGDLSVAALTLMGANTYTGTTTVEGGILELLGATATLGTGDVLVDDSGVKLTIQSGVLNAISDTSILSLAGGGLPAVSDFGFVELLAGIDELIGGLVLNGVPQPNGTYGSSTSNAQFKNDEYFSGTGILTVVPEPGTITGLFGALSMLLGVQRFRRRI